MDGRTTEPNAMQNQNDHDLLIAINIGQQDMRTDVRSISETLRDLKTALDTVNQRQADLEGRMTNISGTVQRSLFDQGEAAKKLSEMGADVSRWKIYLRIMAVIMTPILLGILTLAFKAAEKILFP